MHRRYHIRAIAQPTIYFATNPPTPAESAAASALLEALSSFDHNLTTIHLSFAPLARLALDNQTLIATFDLPPTRDELLSLLAAIL